MYCLFLCIENKLTANKRLAKLKSNIKIEKEISSNALTLFKRDYESVEFKRSNIGRRNFMRNTYMWKHWY